MKHIVGTTIVLYDGICNFCSGVVIFIIKRDPQRKMMFASLQSDVGRDLLSKMGMNPDGIDSFVCIKGDRPYVKSTAALHVFRECRGLWPLLYSLIIVPRPVRDLIYDFIAKRRYQWFGTREQCLVPTSDIKSRFLDM